MAASQMGLEIKEVGHLAHKRKWADSEAQMSDKDRRETHDQDLAATQSTRIPTDSIQNYRYIQPKKKEQL
jgi:hypothetical protein